MAAGADQQHTPRGFSTTRWSLIISGSRLDADEQAAQRALAELCHTYWRPIFAYICRRGHSPEDAQDLTQDFFAMMLRKNWLQNADRTRGRFRSLLLKSLDHFLLDARDRRQSKRRGGHVQFVAWDDWMAEAPSHLTVGRETAERLAPEQLYDLRWAATVVEQALRQLADECEAKGRRRLYEMLSGQLAGHQQGPSYTTLAARLGVDEPTVKRQLHNLRLRYRWFLRKEVARTVGDPAQVEDEIRYLCAVLGAAEQEVA
jgi:RNA polymerase sigma factor (sigma-70 family)